MYVQPYSVRFKHKLNFKSVNGLKYQGDLTSYSDSSIYRISSSLVVQDVKIAGYPSIASGNYSSFLFAAPADPRSEIARYLGFLRANPHKAGLVYFDSAGSSGLLVPIMDNEHHLIGGLDGFRCCIIELKQKEQQPEKRVSIQERGAEQLVAASHYNDLKRERATRHLSHIFHLRNLNNVIKTEIINSAASKAKLDSINIDKKVLTGVSVIDFGCGMGGDVFKWYKNPSGLARYVGVDIAHNSLKQFTERLVSQSHNDYHRVTHLVCADIGNESLSETSLECHTWKEGNAGNGTWQRRVPLTLADQFDIASCQFAMHYMFQSAKQAHHFFGQIAAHLKPGGVFIATTMDCRVLAEALAEQLHGCFDESLQHSDGGNTLQGNENYAGIAPKSVSSEASTTSATATTTSGVSEGAEDPFARIRELHQTHQRANQDSVLAYINDVGGEVLHIKFAPDQVSRLLRRNDAVPTKVSDPYGSDDETDTAPIAAESPYGIQYTFTLHDSTEAAAVDAPEWVVPLGQTLRELAAAHGLRLLETQNFQDILSDMIKNEGKLGRMESMHVFNYKGTLSEAEWRIARLYLKLVFVKDRPGSEHIPSSPDMPPPSSPDGPPPGYFRPSSPDGPPPGYRPSSPDSPPPGYRATKFQPSSPDGPPPGYQPSSPDGPPPGFRPFQPSSPDDPPPGYQPSSPDGPPPGYSPDRSVVRPFVPSSPAGPPPGVNPFRPSSPKYPPPGYTASGAVAGTKRRKSAYGSDSEDEQDANNTKKSRTDEDFNPLRESDNPFASSSASSANPFAMSPSSPSPPRTDAHMRYGSDDDESPATGTAAQVESYNPYTSDSEEEEDEMDPATLFLLRVRARAMELAGGEEAWDALDADSIDHFVEAARAELQGTLDGSVHASDEDDRPFGPSTPDAPPPGMVFPASPNSPPPSNIAVPPGQRVKSAYESDSDSEKPPAAKTTANPVTNSNPYGSDSEDESKEKKSTSANPFAPSNTKVPIPMAPYPNPYGSDDDD